MVFETAEYPDRSAPSTVITRMESAEPNAPASMSKSVKRGRRDGERLRGVTDGSWWGRRVSSTVLVPSSDVGASYRPNRQCGSCGDTRPARLHKRDVDVRQPGDESRRMDVISWIGASRAHTGVRFARCAAPACQLDLVGSAVSRP